MTLSYVTSAHRKCSWVRNYDHLYHYDRFWMNFALVRRSLIRLCVGPENYPSYTYKNKQCRFLITIYIILSKSSMNWKRFQLRAQCYKCSQLPPSQVPFFQEMALLTSKWYIRIVLELLIMIMHVSTVDCRVISSSCAKVWLDTNLTLKLILLVFSVHAWRLLEWCGMTSLQLL